MDTEILNVIAVMQDSLRSIRVLMNEKRIHSTLDYDDECSLIDGDYDRIRQLFLVLLQNAVKYADEDTEIRVESRYRLRIPACLCQNRSGAVYLKNFTGGIITEIKMVPAWD